jgi:hypothetical protein
VWHIEGVLARSNMSKLVIDECGRERKGDEPQQENHVFCGLLLVRVEQIHNNQPFSRRYRVFCF